MLYFFNLLSGSIQSGALTFIHSVSYVKDTLHNNTQQNDTQHNDTQHKRHHGNSHSHGHGWNSVVMLIVIIYSLIFLSSSHGHGHHQKDNHDNQHVEHSIILSLTVLRTIALNITILCIMMTLSITSLTIKTFSITRFNRMTLISIEQNSICLCNKKKLIEGSSEQVNIF